MIFFFFFFVKGKTSRIFEVTADYNFSPSELARRMIDKDGKMFVCSDADYDKEIAYLKEKVVLEIILKTPDELLRRLMQALMLSSRR